MSLLGSEWRKLSKVEQEEWNLKAANSVKVISRTESNRGESINVHPAPAGQEQADRNTLLPGNQVEVEAGPQLDQMTSKSRVECWCF